MIRSIDSELGSLSIPISTLEIGSTGRPVSFSANEDERSGLAQRFGLQELQELRVDGTLTRRSDSDILFRGDIAGKVVQTCVVTLEPVENVVHETIRLRFVPADRTPEPAREVMVEPDESEEIEVMTDNVVDLGPAVAEQFGIGLDPYPRKPGAELPEGISTPEPGQPGVASGSRRPFEVLKNLRGGG